MICKDLKGKVAVVTGAAGFLGPNWIKGLLTQKAKVFATFLPNQDDIESLKSIDHNDLLIYPVDIRSKKDLLKASKVLEKKFGSPDILIANAGIDHPPTSTKTFDLINLDKKSFLKIQEVNVWGTFQSIQVFGKKMIKKKRGVIVVISSLYGLISPNERYYDHLNLTPKFIKHPAYGSSKAALNNLVKYFSTHWAKHNIRINSLSPGGVLGKQDKKFIEKFSQRVPLKRLADPLELINPMLFLASDASSYITGTNLIVDGGYTAW